MRSTWSWTPNNAVWWCGSWRMKQRKKRCVNEDMRGRCGKLKCKDNKKKRWGWSTSKNHTRGITLKRVTSSGDHLRGLAPEQLSFKETSLRWRPVGDTVSDSTCPVIEPLTSRTNTGVYNQCSIRVVVVPSIHINQPCLMFLWIFQVVRGRYLASISEQLAFVRRRNGIPPPPQSHPPGPSRSPSSSLTAFFSASCSNKNTG